MSRYLVPTCEKLFQVRYGIKLFKIKHILFTTLSIKIIKNIYNVFSMNYIYGYKLQDIIMLHIIL